MQGRIEQDGSRRTNIQGRDIAAQRQAHDLIAALRDQLAAAGFRTILDTHLSAERLRAMVKSEAPDVIVIGATAPEETEELALAVRELRESHPDVPIVLGGPAVGGGPPFERRGTRVLERIDESVTAVEDLLARSPSASSA